MLHLTIITAFTKSLTAKVYAEPALNKLLTSAKKV